MSEQEYKTIRVTKDQHDRLAQLGQKGESFEDIIERLLRRECKQ
jgi:predicted CopG family antitoxin